MKQKNVVKQPDKLSSYFKAEWSILLAITITGIIYNIGCLLYTSDAADEL